MSKKISRRGLLIGGGAATALVVGGAFGLEHINVPWVPSNGFTGHIQNIIRADSAVVDSTVTGKYGESFLNHTKKMEITGKITFTKDLDKDRLHRTYQRLTMRVDLGATGFCRNIYEPALQLCGRNHVLRYTHC